MVRSPCFDQNGMKKGAWSEEEDNKLRAYVRRYGHWNWRQLPKFAGLKRCGKSCRLRWLNYLKPGVRRGNYTPQEEELILELHRQFGSKWSVIAARLPGRVDNDIKNHWNSHLRSVEPEFDIDQAQKRWRKMKFHPVEDLISQSPTDESLISHLMNQDEVDSDSSSVSDCEIARVSSLRYDSTLVLQEYPAKDEDITPTESNVGLFWPHIFASNDGNGDPVHLQLPVVLQEEVMGTFTSYLDETNIDNWLHELLQSDGIH